MELLNSYSVNIIKRQIISKGKEIEFKRPILNKYNEVTAEFETVENQKCIYHMAQYVSGNFQGDSGKKVENEREFLLTLFNENIKVNNYCEVGNKKYRIQEIINYNQSNLVMDLLLEVMKDNGN